MKHLHVNEQQKIIRKQILNERGERASLEQVQFAGQSFAELYRCTGCDAWWGNSERDMRETHLVFRLVEPNSTLFSWENFHGWRHAGKVHRCPGCGQEISGPEIMLRFDDEGQVQWPVPVFYTGIWHLTTA